MGPLVITLLMLLAFAGFAALAWRKLQIVRRVATRGALGPARAARCAACWSTACCSSRMLQREWRPGLMHAVIFLGFMSLLLRKLQLIAIGYDETLCPSRPAFGGPVRGLQGRASNWP